MKVYIGRYPRFISTQKLENRWLELHHGVSSSQVDETMMTRLDHQVIFVIDCIQWVLNNTVNRLFSWRGQKVRVKIHKYDTWSADHTLALVILPVLKELRKVDAGIPLIDPIDVPAHLKPTKKQLDRYYETGETDDKDLDRWHWVLDEMIFAFEHIVDDSWEDEFYPDVDEPLLINTLDTGIDLDGIEQVEKRIQNGLELFGKYYRALWT